MIRGGDIHHVLRHNLDKSSFTLGGGVVYLVDDTRPGNSTSSKVVVRYSVSITGDGNQGGEKGEES